MTVFIDDVILKLIEMKKDGYCYCDITEIYVDEKDKNDGLNNFLSFNAVGDFGYSEMDYEDVEEVSEDEISDHAERGEEPFSGRNVIVSIEANVREKKQSQ